MSREENEKLVKLTADTAVNGVFGGFELFTGLVPAAFGRTRTLEDGVRKTFKAIENSYQVGLIIGEKIKRKD